MCSIGAGIEAQRLFLVCFGIFLDFFSYFYASRRLKKKMAHTAFSSESLQEEPSPCSWAAGGAMQVPSSPLPALGEALKSRRKKRGEEVSLRGFTTHLPGS